MDDEVESMPGAGERPSAEKLLVEVYERLARTGTPTPARVWEALRARFAQDWAAYCRARSSDEPPEWDDFPISGPGDVARLVQTLRLTPTDSSRELGAIDARGTAQTAQHRATAVTRVNVPRERVSGTPSRRDPVESVVSPPPPGTLSGRGRTGAAHMTRLPFDDPAQTAGTSDAAAIGEPDPWHDGRTRSGRGRRTKRETDPTAARQLTLFEDP